MRYTCFKQTEWDELQKLIVSELVAFPGCIIDEGSRQRYPNIIRFSCDCGNLIAKSFPLSQDASNEWNQNMLHGYNNEIKVYSHLPDWWPVKIIKTISIPSRCYLIIYSELKGTTNWYTYVPSPACDHLVAECLLQQLWELQKIGVQHNDLKFRNIVLNASENKAVIIDYDAMVETTSVQAGASNIADIVTTLGSHANTKNIATQLVLLALQKQ